MTPPLELRASKIGDLAASLLPHEPQAARVHSVFRRAVNVAFGNEGWLCLHPEGTPLHPYSVVVPGWDEMGPEAHGVGDRVAGEWDRAGELHAAQPGQAATVSRTCVELQGSAVKVSLARAKVWESSLRQPAAPAKAGAVALAVEAAYGTAADRLRGAGYAGGVSPCLRALALECDRASDDDLARRIGEKVAAALDELRDALATEAPAVKRPDACRPRSACRLAGCLRALVGLGPGLTPSGDDFLVGLMAASRALANPTCDLAAVMNRLLPSLAGATTDQSYFMLKAAAAGHYPQGLVELVAAVVAGDADRTRLSTGRLLDLGATSGQDMLAGALIWLDTCREGVEEKV